MEFSSNGQFLVKFANWAKNSTVGPHPKVKNLNSLWKLNLRPQLYMFGWKLVRKILPTSGKLRNNVIFCSHRRNLDHVIDMAQNIFSNTVLYNKSANLNCVDDDDANLKLFMQVKSIRSSIWNLGWLMWKIDASKIGVSRSSTISYVCKKIQAVSCWQTERNLVIIILSWQKLLLFGKPVCNYSETDVEDYHQE